jgi:hypothetical protein
MLLIQFWTNLPANMATIVGCDAIAEVICFCDLTVHKVRMHQARLHGLLIFERFLCHSALNNIVCTRLNFIEAALMQL